jgi:hypothetical protein
VPVAKHQVGGLREGAAPDRFLVGLAVLTLLSEVAEDRPLLCVVDDAQWLDAASAQVLGFVAGGCWPSRWVWSSLRVSLAKGSGGWRSWRWGDLRRRTPAPCCARRSGSGSMSRFWIGSWPRWQVIRWRCWSCPAGWTWRSWQAGSGWWGVQPVSALVEREFRRRLEALPAKTRLLMLVAAAEPSGDSLLVWRAAGRLGIAASAAEATQADGLLEAGTRVRFRHPLVRSAVYSSASLAERRAAHQALAEATERDQDPDRRAWHLAAAAPGPDEQVAMELERSAGRAQARAG